MAKGYGNNIFTPKNVLIYIIIGGIIYAAIYFWFVKVSAVNKPLTILLNAQNDSGEMGTATLTDMNGQTRITLLLTGAPTGVSQPAHIHIGACPNPGTIKYPLTNVLDGKSETILNVPLTQLQQELPLAVNVHKSASEAKIYVSCGDLPGTNSLPPALPSSSSPPLY